MKNNKELLKQLLICTEPIKTTDKNIKYSQFILSFFPFPLKTKLELLKFFEDFSNQDLASFKLKEVGDRYIKFFIKNKPYRFNFLSKKNKNHKILKHKYYEILKDFEISNVPTIFVKDIQLSALAKEYYYEMKQQTKNFTKYQEKDIKNMSTNDLVNVILFIYKGIEETFVLKQAKYAPLIYFLFQELKNRKDFPLKRDKLREVFRFKDYLFVGTFF